MDEISGLVAEEQFFASNLEDFRYGRTARPNGFCLFHCTKEGGHRFSLNFGQPCQTGNEPWKLKVFVSNVDFDPSEISVGVNIKGRFFEYFVLESTPLIQKNIANKITQVLNCHQIANSIIP